MNCKEFEEKAHGIDGLSQEERQELKDHLNQCARDHKEVAWLLEELNFSSPIPANPEQLTASIMQAVSASGKTKSLRLKTNIFRFAAAVAAFALSAAFAWEFTRKPMIDHQASNVTKNESNASFIKRIRAQAKTTNLIAEIRACRAQCLNPLSEGCEACLDLLTNLNNNSK